MMLETKRLRIRTIQPDDAAFFSQMAADGSLRDIGFGPDCGIWLDAWASEAKALAAEDRPDHDYLAYTVERKEDGMVVGSVGCSYYEDLRETGITYFIGAHYRKNGYASEAVRAYAEYFLRHYQLPRIIATIREENTASWKVIEKSGFHLAETRLYQDINDEKPEAYRFYERK